MDTNAEEFRKQVSQRIKDHMEINKKQVGRDFNNAQLIAWISLVASFIGTIWTATGYLVHEQTEKIILAVIVAVPGLMVAIESGFRYSSRVKIHTTAIYTLERFIMRLQRGDDPFKVADDFYTYMIDYGASFPIGSASPKLSMGATGAKASLTSAPPGSP